MAIRKIHPNRAQQTPPASKGKPKPPPRQDDPREDDDSGAPHDEVLSRFTVAELRAYIARRDADDARNELTSAADELPAAVTALEALATRYLEAWARVQSIPNLADAEEITQLRATAWDSISGLRWIVSKFGSKRPGESAAASPPPKPPKVDGADSTEAPDSDTMDVPYTDEVLELLKRQSGVRADAIATAVGCSTKELAPALKALRSAQLVVTEGAARGMTYSLP